jgi:hypothetical protein
VRWPAAGTRPPRWRAAGARASPATGIDTDSPPHTSDFSSRTLIWCVSGEHPPAISPHERSPRRSHPPLPTPPHRDGLAHHSSRHTPRWPESHTPLQHGCCRYTGGPKKPFGDTIAAPAPSRRSRLGCAVSGCRRQRSHRLVRRGGRRFSRRSPGGASALHSPERGLTSPLAAGGRAVLRLSGGIHVFGGEVTTTAVIASH